MKWLSAGWLVVMIVLVSESGPVVAQKGKRVQEAVLQGRPISDWVKQLESKKHLERLRAITVLMQAGPEARSAAPALIRILGDKEASLFHPLAAVALVRMGGEAVPELQKALTHKSAQVRGSAAMTLGQIGAPARPAVPALTQTLKDSETDVRRLAAQTLGRLGGVARPALTALVPLLDDSSPIVRQEAALALWRIGGHDRGVALLSRQLEERDAPLVQGAIAALGEIGSRAKSASPGLRSALTSKEPMTRIAAAEALYRVTQEVKTTLPVLEAAAKGKDIRERRSAISSLGILAKEEQAATRLAELLTSDDVLVRRESASALNEPGAKLATAWKAIDTGLRDRDVGVRWWCALARMAGEEDSRKHEEEILWAFRRVLFVQLGVEPTSRIVTDVQAPARAIPALQQVLRTKSSRLQVEAVRGLGGLSLEAHLALEDLIEAMKRDDKVLHRAIAEALSSLGVEAMVLLTRKLSDADARVREGAARALGRMGVSARSAVSALTRLLKDPESSVRTQAALALWLIDQQADVALSVLNLILKDVDNKDRWETVEAIGTIAVQAQPPIRGITEVLVNALKDRDIRVRLTAARWLFRRVRDAKVVVPLLRDGVSDRDLLARMTAVETLGEMRATDRVVPLLVQALDDRDPTVRLLATESLARLGAEAVSVLIDALDSKSARVRVGIARALTLLGPEAKKAHEAVKALSKDVDATVRSAAEEAREAIASVRD